MIRIRNREGTVRGQVKKSTWRKIQKRQRVEANKPVYGSYIYKFILYLDHDIDKVFCTYKRISGWQMYQGARGRNTDRSLGLDPGFWMLDVDPNDMMKDIV